MTDVSTLEQMQNFAQKLAREISPPTLILLDGPLGVGKTQLVKFLVEAELVHSPTYSLINEYEFNNNKLYHVDLYRLENDSDLESTGFWDLFSSTDNIVVVEWAQRLDPSVWPQNWQLIKIVLQITGEARNLELS